MRDWVTTTSADRKCLESAKFASVAGTWRPWRGVFDRAKRLHKRGLLKEAGISVMPPYKLYVISTEGLEELDACELLERPSSMTSTDLGSGK